MVHVNILKLALTGDVARIRRVGGTNKKIIFLLSIGGNEICTKIWLWSVKVNHNTCIFHFYAVLQELTFAHYVY